MDLSKRIYTKNSSQCPQALKLSLQFKKKSNLVKRLVTSSLLLTISHSVFATQLTSAQVDALISETRELRNEVKQLRKQLNSHTKRHVMTQVKTKPHSVTKSPINVAKPVKKDLPKQSSKKNPKQNVLTLGGVSVVTNPNLGSTPSFDGSSLLTNLAEPGTDLLALQYRQAIAGAFSDSTPKLSPYYLVLSGSLGAQIYQSRPYIGPKTSDTDLTNANLTALAAMGEWVTGFMNFAFDNTPPNGFFPPQIAPRALSSRIYLDQGFITIGNLDKKDWYGSIGQMQVPFGSYNGYMINSPLTSSLFSTTERPLVLGYSHSTDTTELDIQAYTFQGETITSPNQSSINEWGINLDYLITEKKWNTDFGLGYISNIADSEGILLNGQASSSCTIFGGYLFGCQNANQLKYKVPGFDVHGSITYGPFSLVSEYMTAMRHFSDINMTYNEHGAKPRAFDIEAGYAFSVWGKPSNVAFGYAFTKQALALLLPAYEYSMVFTTSIWRNTTESVGFQHDINYSVLDNAKGQNLPVFSNSGRSNLGKTSNTIILAINASF